MKTAAGALAAPTPAYRRLQRRLAAIGYISQGTLVQRYPTRQGGGYMWTRKEQAKTITVALSKEQYQWLRRAVANQRKLERTVEQMQRLSHRILFKTVPGVRRRKHLSRKVLGLI